MKEAAHFYLPWGGGPPPANYTNVSILEQPKHMIGFKDFQLNFEKMTYHLYVGRAAMFKQPFAKSVFEQEVFWSKFIQDHQLDGFLPWTTISMVPGQQYNLELKLSFGKEPVFSNWKTNLRRLDPW